MIRTTSGFRVLRDTRQVNLLSGQNGAFLSLLVTMPIESTICAIVAAECASTGTCLRNDGHRFWAMQLSVKIFETSGPAVLIERLAGSPIFVFDCHTVTSKILETSNSGTVIGIFPNRTICEGSSIAAAEHCAAQVSPNGDRGE
jgi:hypothetical protein